MDDVAKTYDAMVVFVSRATAHCDKSTRILVDVLQAAPLLEAGDLARLQMAMHMVERCQSELENSWPLATEWVNVRAAALACIMSICKKAESAAESQADETIETVVEVQDAQVVRGEPAKHNQ